MKRYIFTRFNEILCRSDLVMCAFLQMQNLLMEPVGPLPPVITDERLNRLWPQPNTIKQLEAEPVVFPKDLQLTVSPGSHFPVHK